MRKPGDNRAHEMARLCLGKLHRQEINSTRLILFFHGMNRSCQYLCDITVSFLWPNAELGTVWGNATVDVESASRIFLQRVYDEFHCNLLLKGIVTQLPHLKDCTAIFAYNSVVLPSLCSKQSPCSRWRCASSRLPTLRVAHVIAFLGACLSRLSWWSFLLGFETAPSILPSGPVLSKCPASFTTYTLLHVQTWKVGSDQRTKRTVDHTLLYFGWIPPSCWPNKVGEKTAIRIQK